jgi:hypothetical protein
VYSAVLWAILGAAALHVAEEYRYPGGFLAAMRAVAPRLAGAATPALAVLVNGAFLALVLAAAAIGTRSLLFSLSVAALVAVNGAGHCLGSLRLRRYLPGTVTGAALYLPLAAAAYIAAVRDEQVGLATAVAAGVLGIAWNALPALYLVIRVQLQRRPSLPT